MKNLLSVLLLVVMISPLVSFAHEPATTTSTPAEQTEGRPPQKKQGVLGKVKSKIKGKKVKKLEALTLTSEQISCISTAMDTRDSAQKKAHTDGAVMVNDAITARNEDLKDALKLSGEDRLKAQEEAHKTFRDMLKKSVEWEQKAVRMAGDTYQKTVKDTCKVTSSDQTVPEQIPEVKVEDDSSRS